MTEREILLKKIGTAKFAITDLDLFLDTHPADQEMLKRREDFEAQLKPLIQQFEKQFGPLTKDDTAVNKWNWVKDPWPWDMEG